jgi:hypothetical protein
LTCSFPDWEVIMRVSTFILFAAALTACTATTDVPGTQANLESAEIGGLKVGLAVDPVAVRPGEEFAVRFTVANTTGDTIRLHTPHSCLALPHVLRDGKRVPFEGTALGCLAVVRTHVFAPGYEWATVFRLRAALYSENPGDVHGADAPEGEYLVQMVFETAGNPAIRKELVVR